MSRLILEDEADYVVVGTGAGGATAARVLTGAGRSVALLEEGPNIPPRKRSRSFLDAMTGTFREAGSTAALGPAPFPLIQGRLVGGGTAINSGIVMRLPEFVRTDWVDRFGLKDLLEPAELDRIYERIEKELGVEETPDNILGGNSRLLREGAKALGLESRPTLRNTPGCKGRGECQLGCPTEQRQSMDVSYVPRSIQAGARLHALARVRRVRIRAGRAEAVEGDVLDETARYPIGKLLVRAKKGVIIAGGPVQTPLILRRSGIKGLAGDRFQAHPGSAVIGRFREPVGISFGATQGYQVLRHEEGFKIESLSLPPEMLATRLPGAGAEWQERLLDMDHLAHWAIVPRMEALGTVRPLWPNGALVRYSPLPQDLEKLRRGVVLACRMMFAAGAYEVYPHVGGRPPVLTSASQVELIERGPLRPGDLHIVGTHLFGTACAGSDPSKSVVDPDLKCRDVEGLYVMDASVFPTNTGVNPQHSIMALVWKAAERLG